MELASECIEHGWWLGGRGVALLRGGREKASQEMAQGGLTYTTL